MVAAPAPGGRATAAPASAVLGVVIFLGTEAMFFAGLVSAFVILRAGSTGWPPPDQPRLPVAVTGANTVVLLASAATMRRALAAIREGRERALGRWLLATALLGAVFLSVQGSEWARLVHYGLSARTSLYGATFYTIVGAHGVHVAGALAALVAVLARAARGRYSRAEHVEVEVCCIYWCFVAAVWPVLYLLVYMS